MRPAAPWRGGATALIALIALGATVACHSVEGPESTLEVFEYPIAISVHPEGRWLYVASSNFEGRFQEARGGALHVVDTDTLQIEDGASMRIPSFAGSLTLGLGEQPDDLYVGLRGPGRMIALSLENEGARVRCLEGVDATPCAVASLPRDIFDLVAVAAPADMPVDRDVRHVAVASLGGQLTLVSLPEGRASEASRTSRRFLNGLNALHYPTEGGPLLVGARFERGVQQIDWVLDDAGRAEGLYTSGRIALPAGAGTLQESRGIVLDPERELLYVLTANPGGIFVVDVGLDDEGRPRNRLLERIDIDGRPSAMRLVREDHGDFLYLTLLTRDEVAVVDLETRTLTQRIPVGVTPYGLAVDQLRHQRLYVALFEEHAIGVIDLNPDHETYRTLVEVIR